MHGMNIKIICYLFSWQYETLCVCSLVYVFSRRWEKSFYLLVMWYKLPLCKKFHGARKMSLSRTRPVDKADVYRAYVNTEYMNNPWTSLLKV
jgi:hypothetical protein